MTDLLFPSETPPDPVRPQEQRQAAAYRWVRNGVLAVLFAVAAATGSYAAFRLFEDSPDVQQLADYRASTITRLTDATGNQVAEFAIERRVVLDYRDLPPHLTQAIVAVEDARFYEHGGINIRGILRAAMENAKAGRIVQGGSSLTQQLAKVMFLTPERHLARKIKEAILALNIERSYSKEEIITLYSNQVYLGHNRYGVEAASRFYFGKPVGELTLPEAAMIAGLPQRPEGYSPYRYPEAAVKRRDHVLERMAAVGYITAVEAAEAKATPLALKQKETPTQSASHFVEEVRRYLEDRYGVQGLYHDGLRVQTTVNPVLQAAAERAVKNGLLALDHRRGWRGASENVLAGEPGTALADWTHPTWNGPPAAGELVTGLVERVADGAVVVRVGELRASVPAAPGWTKASRVGDLFRAGDVGLFRVLDVEPVTGALQLEVEQEPASEAALVAIDVETGAIRAMVGGWDFRRSKFNRAVQAKRQTGSAFKPLVYASALAHGFTPADVLFDEPISITDPSTGAVYSPENHGRKYFGLTTVREALERSRNPFSVQLLMQVGPDEVIRQAQRLGITARLEPYPSLALGAFEVSLLEMTNAYAALADRGLVHTPYLVERVVDRDDRVLEQHNPISAQAMEPEVAFLTTRLLQGVIQNGTGRKARHLGTSLAGKTGTTDDFTDAWFIGYSPSIAVGVWVGNDRKETLGRNEEGAKAALPIWMEFMEAAIAESPQGEEFPRPSDIEYVTIDKATGLRASPGMCSNTIKEAFRRGTAPVKYCSLHEHEVRALPYYLQKLMLADGAGTIPENPFARDLLEGGGPGDGGLETDGEPY